MFYLAFKFNPALFKKAKLEDMNLDYDVELLIESAAKNNPALFKKTKLEDVNLDSSVELLRESAAKSIGFMSSSEIELVFAGNVLKDGFSLRDIGLRPGLTIHALRKVNTAETVPPAKVKLATSKDVSNCVTVFKHVTRDRTALQCLSRASIVENIIEGTPGLREDPIALAIITDPELIAQLCDAATVQRVLEAHPIVLKAAKFIIVSGLHHGASTSSSPSSSAGAPSDPSSGYYYSLDALDDVDMQADAQAAQPRDDMERITLARLESALINAARHANGGQTPTPARDDRPSGSMNAEGADARADNTPSNITSEMVRRALQEAMTSSSIMRDLPSSASPATPAVSSSMRDLESTSRRLAEQLAQMRELGLTDDTLNLQALQATDWNVLEATNLLFSGALENLNEPAPE